MGSRHPCYQTIGQTEIQYLGSRPGFTGFTHYPGLAGVMETERSGEQG